MTNNEIIKKLRIALELKDTDIIEIFALSGLTISKSELNAFFRRPDHRNFQILKDQHMKKFLNGLAKKFKDQ